MQRKQQRNSQKSTPQEFGLMISGIMIPVSQPKQVIQKIKLPQTRQTSRILPKKDLPKQVQKVIVPQFQEPTPQIIPPEQDSPEPQVVYQINQMPITKQEQAPAIFREGEVTVRYSHYKDKFPILDGILLESVVDEQYCLSHVFKGNYEFLLRHEKEKLYLNKQGASWVGVEDQKTYIIEVDEDPEQVILDAQNHRKYEAFNPREVKGTNNQSNLITKELEEMTIEELLDKGAKYKELIEARDLEDILYR